MVKWRGEKLVFSKSKGSIKWTNRATTAMLDAISGPMSRISFYSIAELLYALVGLLSECMDSAGRLVSQSNAGKAELE